jgi:hypothetical protein
MSSGGKKKKKKKQVNVPPLKFHSKDNTLAEIHEREFRSILLKMISELKEDTNN